MGAAEADPWELFNPTHCLVLVLVLVLRVAAHAPPPIVSSYTWASTLSSQVRCFLWNVCALLTLWVNKILHILTFSLPRIIT